MEGYSDIAWKEIRYTKEWHVPASKKTVTDTLVTVSQHGVISMSEELFDQMMTERGWIRNVEGER